MTENNGNSPSRKATSDFIGISAMKDLKSFIQNDEATTAVEYAVLLAFILLSVITAVSSVGGATGRMWGNVDAELSEIL